MSTPGPGPGHAGAAPGDTTLAQVVFADCRAPGPVTSSPGWKVKDVAVAPGTVPPSRRTLEAVESVAQVHHADLALAAAGRSAEAPATLKQLRLDDVVLLANFADAGLDRTGRASHTVHGILHDGMLSSPDGTLRRPVELLDSPMWLRPVGQDAVEALAVAGRPFDLPRGPVDLDAVAGDDFLTDLDRPERIAALPIVLEAFRSALEEGATLAVVAPDRDEVVGWLALLQCLLDPASAARLRFSTREDLHDGHLSDLQVIGVLATRGLRDAVPDYLDPRVLVVDVANPPASGPDGSWALPGGTTLHRSLWTDVAELVLSSPRTARLVRRTLDDLAVTAGPTVVAAPLWALPLATVVAGIETIEPPAVLGLVVRNWPPVEVGAAAVADTVARHFRELQREDPTLAASLALQLGPGVPTRVVDDVLDAWVHQVLAAPGAPDGGAVWPGRRLSEPAAASLGRELPALIGWFDGAPPDGVGGAAVRVWNVSTAVGVPPEAVAAALRPHVGPMPELLTDPTFDPVAAGWGPVPPGLWQMLLSRLLDDRLAAGGGEVSDASHRWLEPVLGDLDRPEAAAHAHRLELSAYGWHRASHTTAPAEDPWFGAVVTAARGRALAREPGRTVAVALSTALRETFGDRPLPPEIALALLADLPMAELDGAMVVSTRSLVGSDGGPEYRKVADFVWQRLTAASAEQRTDAGLVYLHVVLDALVEGGPEAAADPSVCAAAEYLAGTVLPSLPESRIRDIGWSVVLGWVLRLPIAVLRSTVDDPDQPDDSGVTTTYGAYVSSLLGDADIATPVLDAALESVLRRLEPAAARRVLANLVVRTGLVFLEWTLPARDEPVGVYLRLSAPGNVSRFMREAVAMWLESQPPTEIEELRRAVGDVIYGLADLGWGPEEIHYLEEDREHLFAMLHNRNLLGRVRPPR
ncbi:GAP1-M domain-containing protein [Jatrophihabitans sp. YIM 134969]